MRELVTYVQYGISAPATEAKVGYPILRMNNLQNDGWELSDLKYIELTENEVETYRLQNGDILFNRTNSKELVGKCEVFKEKGDWVFASYLVRVRIDESIALPDFVSIFLNTSSGRVQIDRVSRQIIGMANINAEEIRDLVIPIAPLDRQYALVAEIQTARKTRNQLLEEVDAILDSIDGYVLTELGIQVPAIEEKKCFAVYTRRIVGRLDPKYNQPKLEVYKEPKSYFAPKRIKELSIDIRTGLPIRQDFRSNDGKYPYYGANGIIGYMDDYTHDGRYLVVGQDGYIGKHYVVEGKFWASNHNWVATFREDVNLEYVKAFLDAWNYEYLITGGVIPKLTKEAFESISIPIPPFEIQEKIADEAVRRQSEAAKLRQQAAEGWEAAKAQFGTQLLTGEVS